MFLAEMIAAETAEAHGSHAMLLTVTAAIAAGVMLIVIARRLDIPAIVLLLVGGVVLGPQVLNLTDPSVLGDGLLVIVSLSIGLILFEGGLTLDVSGYQSAPRMIKRLLSVGVLTTWAGTTGIIYLLHKDVSFEIAVVSGSLVIVTGPTVIAPLLKRIKVNAKLHSILHWEGVLIDPVGVFIALLCLEYVIPSESAFGPITSLLVRVGWGLAVGFAGGGFAYLAVKRKWIHEDVVNVFALGTAIATFCIAEWVITEAGLLAVTVAGFVFGLAGGSKIKQVRAFKGELTDLLIGTLFILLAARLEFRLFGDFGMIGALSVMAVVFLVRPLNIMLCSIGVNISGAERAFLSWVAPRGIVAASMASLIAIRLGTANEAAIAAGEAPPFADPRFVETFTYSVIILTIMLQGSTAGAVGRMLGVGRPEPKGWLIVGAGTFGRSIASFLNERLDADVIIVDTNPRAISEATSEGLVAVQADGREVELYEREDFQGIGNLLALTDNEDLNVRLCQNWAEVFGADHVFRCNPTDGQPQHESDDDKRMGAVVWPNLPKPSLLAAEINRGEASTLQAVGFEPAFAKLAVPTVTVRGKDVTFDAPVAEESAEEVPSHTLYLKRRADYLGRSLRPELVTTLAAQDLGDLFKQLVDLVVQLYPTVSREAAVAELLDRETSFPTALGGGVAVPHAYSADLDSRVCAVARVPEGIDFKAPDGEPVRLVFLLLSPQGDPEGHLATLADIARLVIDPDIRVRLLEAASPFDVLSIVRSPPAS